MSGIKGFPLIYPALIKNNQIVQIPSNFNATSKIERAKKIIDNSGLFPIKAQIVKVASGQVTYDVVD